MAFAEGGTVVPKIEIDPVVTETSCGRVFLVVASALHEVHSYDIVRSIYIAQTSQFFGLVIG